jgi:D-arabinose 1-dehydrogenase-like Zn-dependent alcohol dehydrogenase
LEIGTHPDPAPAATEVLVKVKANGVCRTDWHFWNVTVRGSASRRRYR